MKTYQIAGIKLLTNDFSYLPDEDTFLLLDLIIETLNKINPVHILELGTGTGFLVISIAKKFEKIKLIATDIGPTCILASKNAEINGCQNIYFVRTDLFSAFKKNNPIFDMILFNPPYVVSKPLYPDLENLNYIDRIWAGGINGQEIILRFLREVRHYIRPEGLIYLLISSKNNYKEINEEIGKSNLLILTKKEKKLPMERLKAICLSLDS